MDLEKLKVEYVKAKIEKQSIATLKSEAMKRYSNFILCNKELMNKYDIKKKELKDKLEEEAKIFFESNGFKFKRDGSNMIASYDDLIIELKEVDGYIDIYYDVIIKIKSLVNRMVIRPSKEHKNIFRFVKSIIINGVSLDENNYKEIINGCDDIETITKVVENIDNNIVKCNESIKFVEKIRFVYSREERDIECDSFEELFEKYIN